MIHMTVFKGGRPGEVESSDKWEFDESNAGAKALWELMIRLFGSTRIDENDCSLDGLGRVLIECLNADPVEFVLFEGKDTGMIQLMQASSWYAETTLLCSERVWETIKEDVWDHRNRPLAPAPR